MHRRCYKPLMHTVDPDDARLVFAAIARSNGVCVECIVRETGVTRARVTVILGSTDAALRVFSDSGPCSGCREMKRVFRLRDSS